MHSSIPELRPKEARTCLPPVCQAACLLGIADWSQTTSAMQDVLEEEERAMLLAARHRPNAALQVLSQVIAHANPREGRVRRQF